MNGELNKLSKEIHEGNVKRGFWEERINVPKKMLDSGLFTEEEIQAVESAFKSQLIALVTSELSEALEADRKSINDYKINEDWLNQQQTNEEFKSDFEKSIKDTFQDEIADSMIRLLDMSAGLGIDIDSHIKAKLRYNALRPYKHGKKY